MAVRFGPFTLDDRARTLRRGALSVHLSPKAFDLLTMLVQQRPAAISKAEIHQRLWPDTFVSEGNPAVLIAEIREALGDQAREPRFVRTVHRYGYAFCGSVADLPADAATGPDVAPCWLTWGTRRASLAIGSNVVGRDPAADVCIDAIGISRRHAVIVVSAREVTIADLASKNGTFANGTRVDAPVPLIDDTEIRLGPVPVRFRRLADSASTQTWSAARSARVLE